MRNSIQLMDWTNDMQLHVVSDATHIPRVRLYAALAGIPARFHGVPSRLRDENPARYAYYRIYEVAALVKYAAVGLIDRYR